MKETINVTESMPYSEIKEAIINNTLEESLPVFYDHCKDVKFFKDVIINIKKEICDVVNRKALRVTTSYFKSQNSWEEYWWDAMKDLQEAETQSLEKWSSNVWRQIVMYMSKYNMYCRQFGTAVGLLQYTASVGM